MGNVDNSEDKNVNGKELPLQDQYLQMIHSTTIIPMILISLSGILIQHSTILK